MKIAITGTPGVGKSTVAKLLVSALPLPLFDISRLVKERELYTGLDKRRNTYIVDEEKLLDFLKNKENFIAEGLAAYIIPSDYLVILRLNPDEVAKRLIKRNYTSEKVNENVEAERLGIIATDAMNLGRYKHIIHMDTTGKKPEEIAKEILKLIENKEDLIENVDYL